MTAPRSGNTTDTKCRTTLALDSATLPGDPPQTLPWCPRELCTHSARGARAQARRSQVRRLADMAVSQAEGSASVTHASPATRVTADRPEQLRPCTRRVVARRTAVLRWFGRVLGPEMALEGGGVQHWPCILGTREPGELLGAALGLHSGHALEPCTWGMHSVHSLPSLFLCTQSGQTLLALTSGGRSGRSVCTPMLAEWTGRQRRQPGAHTCVQFAALFLFASSTRGSASSHGFCPACVLGLCQAPSPAVPAACALPATARRPVGLGCVHGGWRPSLLARRTAEGGAS